MKPLRLFPLLGAVMFTAQVATAGPLGTAFTYQGKLTDGTNAANGRYDLQFTLYAALSGGGQIGSLLATNAVSVSNGLFTVTLDFGGGVFTGDARWLDIAVKTNGAGVFTPLAPRQPLTPSPYALFAPSAGEAASAVIASNVTAGSIGPAALALGAVTTEKLADGTIAAADLSPAVLSNTFWRLSGNAGTAPGPQFLGTTDNQPLELKVNGLRALRLEDNGDSSDTDALPDGAPNVIGGSPGNFVAAGVVGATIAGGGATNFGGFVYANSVLANFGVIGGGLRNRIAAGSEGANIAGGYLNGIGTNAHRSAIGGGTDNTIAANSSYSTIAGGVENDIGDNSDDSTIGGGLDNNILANSPRATIGGGEGNDIGEDSDRSTIGGGYDNNIGNVSWSATIGGGELNGIGRNSDYSTIGGGYDNHVGDNSFHATIAGGYANEIRANADFSAIGGGENNRIVDNAPYAVIPGGYRNSATTSGFAAGTQANANHEGAFVWGDATYDNVGSFGANTVTMRAMGGYRFYSAWLPFRAGVSLAAGGGSWTTISDRNAKEDFQPVNPVEVLGKVAALPLTTWKYRSQDASVRHIGPVAQDFHAAFAVGESDTGITTIDADGVALAAIQGLNQKVEAENGALRSELKEKDARIAAVEKRNQGLESRLAALEKAIAFVRKNATPNAP